MDFENTAEFADQLDAADSLSELRSDFLIPLFNGDASIYFCGNSLGLQPRRVKEVIGAKLEQWQQLGVEGWFNGTTAWLRYHEELKSPLAGLLGAHADEITVMNALTVNLHLLLVSFYRPGGRRRKIMLEAGAFPSDRYAVDSQLRFHGLEPSDCLIEVHPRPGEYTLRTNDILEMIKAHADELALVLFSGINYYTGQFFDMQSICAAAQQAGAYAGFDLAHAAGNVPLRLHDWNIDFAVWCSYKYLNSGPGGISGIFVHQRHCDQPAMPRFAGWWGEDPAKRFLMGPQFGAGHGADAWQLSTSPILLLAVHEAALEVFQKAGGLNRLRQKSIALTAYLEWLIRGINHRQNHEVFRIITPAEPEWRGCQLSLVCRQDGRRIFDYLSANGLIADWREPDVIRLSPVPLYNTFREVYTAGRLLEKVLQKAATADA